MGSLWRRARDPRWFSGGWAPSLRYVNTGATVHISPGERCYHDVLLDGLRVLNVCGARVVDGRLKQPHLARVRLIVLWGWVWRHTTHTLGALIQGSTDLHLMYGQSKLLQYMLWSSPVQATQAECSKDIGTMSLIFEYLIVVHFWSFEVSHLISYLPNILNVAPKHNHL